MGTARFVIVEFNQYRQEGLVARIYRVDDSRDQERLGRFVSSLPDGAMSDDFQSYDGRDQGDLEVQLTAIFEDMANNVTLEDLGFEDR